jgi:hypothetical protein
MPFLKNVGIVLHKVEGKLGLSDGEFFDLSEGNSSISPYLWKVQPLEDTG